MTNRVINIDRVVITPNLISGSNEPKVKLKKPIAVVKDVKKTGLPIFFKLLFKKISFVFYYTICV